MAKQDRQKERVENMTTGQHLGGTKFGQTPGTNRANHAKPAKPSDRSAHEDKKGADDD